MSFFLQNLRASRVSGRPKTNGQKDEPMNLRLVSLGLMLTVAACQLPAFLPGGGGNAKQSSYSKTTKAEEVNGEPIEVPPELEEETPRKRSKKKVAADDFGATCKTNANCSSKTCF